MSDNSNNVHFSGVRFICSPYLAIKLALASLGLIMARCGAANESYALKMNIIGILSTKWRSIPQILLGKDLYKQTIVFSDRDTFPVRFPNIFVDYPLGQMRR